MVPAGSRLQMDGDTSEPSLSLYNAFTRHKPNIGMKILIPTLNMFQIQWKTCNCQFLQIFSVLYVHAVNGDTGECFQLQKRNLWKLWPLFKKNGAFFVFCAGVSGNSRFPWFPGIQASNFPSLPFPWHFKFSLPVPGKRKFWTGIRTGNTIIICSFEHFLMCSLYVKKE